MLRMAFLLCSIASLASCKTDSVILPKQPFIGKTAAEKALVPGALPIALVSPSALKPGHIYKVGAGSFYELCENDLLEQTALKEIKAEKTAESDDSIEDSVRLSGARLSFLGQSLSASYDRIKVDGFSVFKPSQGNPTYVLNNVRRGKESCYDDVLPRNKPYLIVNEIAVGKKVDSFTKIGANLDVGFGPLSGTYTGEEVKTGTRTNVVFGATGLLVK